jgi:hypothetical protein
MSAIYKGVAPCKQNTPPTCPFFQVTASHMEDVFPQHMAYNEPLIGCVLITESGKDISVEDAHNVIR